MIQRWWSDNNDKTIEVNTTSKINYLLCTLFMCSFKCVTDPAKSFPHTWQASLVPSFNCLLGYCMLTIWIHSQQPEWCESMCFIKRSIQSSNTTFIWCFTSTVWANEQPTFGCTLWGHSSAALWYSIVSSILWYVATIRYCKIRNLLSVKVVRYLNHECET